jgi:hypothetical protein
MKAYHVTDEIGYTGIIADGCIKPCRLANVYLFRNRADAEGYLVGFGKCHILEVEITSSQIESQWKPSYAKHGVIKLKKGEKCLTT